MKKPREINVNIDELIVPFLPHGGERRLIEAVQKELQRLLVQDAVTWSGSAQHGRYEVNGGRLAPRCGAHSENIGKEIAEKIHKRVLGK
jgi:hypothetical protein